MELLDFFHQRAFSWTETPSPVPPCIAQRRDGKPCKGMGKVQVSDRHGQLLPAYICQAHYEAFRRQGWWPTVTPQETP
jgi:hypothetical protein